MTHRDDRRQQEYRPARVPRLTGVADTLRTEGVRWVWRRLRYRTPATATGRALHAWLRWGLGAALSAGRRRRTGASITSPDVLYAFYDLQVSPITYDAAWFAALADRARRRQHLQRVHFVIVPGTIDGLREERAAYEAAVDREMRRWRLYNIVLGIFSCVPAGAGYSLLPLRDVASALRAAAGTAVYPASYEPAFPVGHHPSELFDAARAGEQRLAILEAPVQAQRFIERWLASRLGQRRLVTITLRDYAFMPERNSNIEAWASFARRLDPGRYLPVFVLDTERTLDPTPARIADHQVLREASWSVPLRLALYERAFLNLGVNNGPFLMAMLALRPRMLAFKMITPTVPQTTDEFMRRLGFEIGGQLPFAGPFQRLVWENDTLDVIVSEFTAMVAHIDTASPAAAITAGA